MAKILLCEDNPGLLHLTCLMLSLQGHEVLPAREGAEGWALAQGSALDLVLTDVEMPELDGLALLERIKSSQPGLPVLVMSGNPDYRLPALGRGAAAFLLKPFRGRELAEETGRLLGQRTRVASAG